MSSVASKRTGRTGRTADIAKRNAIISAATRAFFEGGYAATSIEQIAAAAGVSKVTIYSHFGDKRGLFASAVDNQCALMRQHLQIDGAAGGSLRDRLRTIGTALVAFLSRPEMIQFERRIAAETEVDPAIGAAFLSAGPHRMKAELAALMRAMDAAGDVTIADAELAAEQFAALCKGMGDLDRRFGRPADAARDRQRIEGAVDMFCRAYAVVE